MSESLKSSASLSGRTQAVLSATEEDKQKLKALVKEIGCGMLCTTDKDGQMHSRPMTVSGEMVISEGECSLWFFTYASSHKVLELSEHGHQCSVAFSNPAKKVYLSLSGTGQLSKDRGEIEKRWHPSLDAWFPSGISQPDVALLKIVLTGAEYWDGASSVMPHAVSFAQSQKTGVPADPAYHKAMSIKCDKPEQKVQA